MSWIQSLIQYFSGYKRTSFKQGLPQDMPQEALDKAMAEARFLAQQHQVEVRELALDEAPSNPKPVNTDQS